MRKLIVRNVNCENFHNIIRMLKTKSLKILTNESLKKIIVGFYLLPIIHGLWGLYVIFAGRWTNFSEFYYSYTGMSNFSFFTIFFGLLSLIITILSVGLVFFVWIKKLSGYNYIYPIYNLSYFIIPWVFFPIVFNKYCLFIKNTDYETCVLSLMDKIILSELIHPFIQILLPIYIIRKVTKDM